MVNIGHRRKLDLAVEVPPSELGPVASNEMWGEIYDRIAELALQHRSTLVFVNTRRLAERVALHLGERIGEELVAAHHGSLARKLRLAAERKLKNGEIRLLVATASLELGIDIGNVDLVCQINSPRAIAVALQRIGRAGHWRGAVPKGRLFATTRDDLVECAAAVRAIKQGDLDRIQIPEEPLDILAQQIVAMCSCEDWDEDALFDCVRRAYPYRGLRAKNSTASGNAVARHRCQARPLRRVSVSRHGQPPAARRGVERVWRRSPAAARFPDTALFTVVAQPDEIVVGTVDEDFAVESNAGDIMLLGNTSWRIRRIESNSGRVLVEDAHGAPPKFPSGGEKRRRAPPSFRTMWPNCGSGSARCYRTRLRCQCRQILRCWARIGKSSSSGTKLYPTSAKAALVGDPGSSPRDDKSKGVGSVPEGDDARVVRRFSAASRLPPPLPSRLQPATHLLPQHQGPVCAASNPARKCRTRSHG